MYEAHRRSYRIVAAMALNLSKARKDRTAQHIYVGLINDVTCKLEHVK